MTARRTRGATRRPKAIRFRFRSGGEDHRAVTVNVSATGGFLKASDVPARGSEVVLEEMHPDRDRALRLRGEVRWCVERPTLDRPEPGFGMHFVAAWSPDGDERRLREFLGLLSPEIEPEVVVRERDGVQVALHRFPGVDDGEEEQPSPGDAAQPEFESIDLEMELRHIQEEMEAPPETGASPFPGGEGQPAPTRPFDPRMRERVRRRVDTSRRGGGRVVTEKFPAGSGSGLSAAMEAARTPRSRSLTRPRVSTARRSRPNTRETLEASEQDLRADRASRGEASSARRVPRASGGPTPGSGARQRPAQPPAEVDEEPRAEAVQVVEEEARGEAPDEAPDERPRKGRITGLFNAIFGMVQGEEDEDEDDLAESPSRSGLAAPAGSDDALMAGAAGADVVVRWRERTTAARVLEISESMVSLVTAGEAPEYYERVSLAPTPRGGPGADFMMFGTVTRVREASATGERTFSVRFMKVDEKGQTGAFQQFLRYCSRG